MYVQGYLQGSENGRVVTIEIEESVGPTTLGRDWALPCLIPVLNQYNNKIPVKFYLYLDSFCLLCKTICMPQVKWARNGNKDIVLYCTQLWFPVSESDQYNHKLPKAYFCNVHKNKNPP
jgi:hypothetical protein